MEMAGSEPLACGRESDPRDAVYAPAKVSTSSFTFNTTMTSAITQAIAPSQRGATSAPIVTLSVTIRTSG